MSTEKQIYASKLWWDSKTPVAKEEAIALYHTGDEKHAEEMTQHDILEMWRCFLLTVASRVKR